MKSIYEWNDEYALYHKNKTNKVIHWFCIPLIMYSLFGLLSLLTFTYNLNGTLLEFNILSIFIALVVVYYFRLSKKLALGMLIFSIILVRMLGLVNFVNSESHFAIYLFIFIIAWIGQFIGHKIEGKKPAFLKDLQFLLIGPLWLLSFIYKKLNIKL